MSPARRHLPTISSCSVFTPPIVYTFLATLILLLAVSSAIVSRSLILRRRHGRMVAEAIATGTWMPPDPRVSVKVDLRAKPQLWDAWVQSPMLPRNVHGAGGEKAKETETERDDWDRIMPFAASYTPLSTATPPSLAPPSAHLTLNPNPSAPAVPEPIPPTPTPGTEHPRVRIAVLIAMPAPGMVSPSFPSASPPPPHSTPARAGGSAEEDADAGLPHLEVGVASVGVVVGDGDGMERRSEG
ncbi:hypothetical protein B0H12DRAFT_1123338 [Mycena haematopus]|nr:hypothetical protein B0H12DRAFT_1123338 [Mycena haematopus]